MDSSIVSRPGGRRRRRPRARTLAALTLALLAALAAPGYITIKDSGGTTRKVAVVS